MPSVEILIALLNAARELAPIVQADLARGTVTPEQQAALKAAREQTRFTGPEWQITG